MAGKPVVQKFVNNTNIAATAIGATQPAPTIIQQGFPVGDVVLNYIHLRYYGTVTFVGAGAGAIVERGGLKFLRSLRLETPKHTSLVDGLDGLMLHQMETIENGVRPGNRDIATNAGGSVPDFDYSLTIPFYTPRSGREADTALDMYSCPSMTLTTTVGTQSDFCALGAATSNNVSAFSQEVEVEMVPGPIDPLKEGPILQPYKGVRKETISATATQYQIILPYSDRIYKKLYISQRSSAAPFNELANTIVGANADRLAVKLNGYSFVDQIQWLALQDRNAAQYGLSAMPTGLAVVDWTPRKSGGYSYGEALNTISNVPGTLELDIDISAAPANGQLWLGYDCAKPINPSALRPAAPTAR